MFISSYATQPNVPPPAIMPTATHEFRKKPLELDSKKPVAFSFERSPFYIIGPVVLSPFYLGIFNLF